MEQEKKRNKYLLPLMAIVGGLVSLLTSFYYSKETSDLSMMLGERDAIIDSIKTFSISRDSLAMQYAKIDEYIKGCEINVNGKSIKYSDLVSELSKVIKERDDYKEQVRALNDAINFYISRVLEEVDRNTLYSDSISKMNYALGVIKKNYGINMKISKETRGDTIFWQYDRDFGKADSALLVWPHFKGKIYRLTSDSSDTEYMCWRMEFPLDSVIVTKYVSEKELKKFRKQQKK
jgi:hypothetical protein